MKEDQHTDSVLHDERERMAQMVIPADIDHYIHEGMLQAKRRLAKRKSWRRRLSAAAACVLVAGVLVSIRLSPAVAAYVSHIPGLEKLVELIRDDKGLQLAAENDMIQTVGASARHDGVSFTVDEVLMDQRRMVIFYTIRHEEKGHKVGLSGVTLHDSSDMKWEYGASWSNSGMNESNEVKERMDVYLEETSHIPDRLTATVTVTVDDVALDTPFEVSFPIDKSRYANLKESVYPVHKEITIDNQRFTIDQITVYPTQTEVGITFDPANTKHIYEFDQLRLIDEKGQTFAFWGNGVPYGRKGKMAWSSIWKAIILPSPKNCSSRRTAYGRWIRTRGKSSLTPGRAR